ncbi:MAG: hypothetical protein GY874_21795 [Desulfobacteraceae bacterium]|nr:hypothetical protein [Desulfobacteraceae bacterium]
MKINPLDKQQLLKSPKTAPKKSAGQSDFGKILTQTSQKAASEKPAVSAPAKTMMPAAINMQFENQIKVHQGLEQMLNLLEDYQHRLSDTNANLRSIEPAVQKVKHKSQELQALMSKMPEQDPLKAIIDEVLMVASKETIRFELGEYTSR